MTTQYLSSDVKSIVTAGMNGGATEVCVYTAQGTQP